MRRALALALALVSLTVPTALAQETEPPPPPPADTGAPPPPPEPAPLPAVVPEGVTIAGVAVGGLAPEEAAAAVQAWFDRPLRLRFRNKRWRASPQELGATPYVDGAVERALAAPPGTALDLYVHIAGADVRTYVAYLDGLLSGPAREPALRLKKFRPYLTKPRDGVKVLRNPTTAAIVRALRTHDRGPLELEARIVPPERNIASFGPVIVIRRETKKLYLYRGMRFWKRFGVATGQASYPTPLGRFEIVVKQRNPWWYPPDSDWAAGASPIPPGPGNPLGTRWLGLSEPLVGIHGTPDAASIGYSASHGCIRMRIPDAEWLFDHVPVGTSVFIVRA